jgi:hypothetical protein
LYVKALILGLFAAIAMLILEMVLFILRAVNMEKLTEKAPSQKEIQKAKQRSGALITPADALS